MIANTLIHHQIDYTTYRQYFSHKTAAPIQTVIICEILKFPGRPSRAYSSSKSSETVFCVPKEIVVLHTGHHITSHPTDIPLPK